MSDRPNVLLFVTDDHAPWVLGCYGNSEVRSPTFDRLAREGVRFANAFTPCPVCSPGRACLMTGLTNSQVGIHDFLSWPYDEHDWLAGHATLGEILSREGYVCGYSGKWHLAQNTRTPRGFSYFFSNTLRPAFGGTARPGSGYAHLGERECVFNDELFILPGNFTTLATDYALLFLEGTPGNRPFFLVVGYIATHSPYTGQDPELVALYDDATFRDIPEYKPHPWRQNEDFHQGPGYFRDDIVKWDYSWGRPRADAAYTREDILIRHKNQYAAVTDIDRHISRIYDRLHEMGRLDDTLIVYTSDHGLSLGNRGFWGKGNGTRPLNMYEISIRVPLIVRYPRQFQPGLVVERCVDHYDTFQTICDLAGVSLAEHDPAGRAYPGRSYRALAMGQDVPDWRDTRYGEYGDLRMIRTPQFKLVKRYPAGPDDLFDLQNDPGEERNLAGLPEYAAIQASLLAELESWYAAHEDPAKSGLRVKELRPHNHLIEAWRDGVRESRGLQVY